MHLDAIKADCDALAMDVEKSLRLKDTNDEDSIADFSANNEGAQEKGIRPNCREWVGEGDICMSCGGYGEDPGQEVGHECFLWQGCCKGNR